MIHLSYNRCSYKIILDIYYIFIILYNNKFKLCMLSNSISTKQQINYYKNYTILKSNLNLPLKIKIFFSLLEATYLKNHIPNISKDQIKKYKLIISAFKRQSQQEQEKFLFEVLSSLKSMMNRGKDRDQDSNSSQSDSLDVIKEIETSCKIKQSFLGFNKWQRRAFKFNIKNNKIKIINSKSKQIVLNLAFYFVRKSSKHSKTLILEAISETIQQSKSQFYISFDDSILFEEIYHHILQCIIQLACKQLLKIIHERQTDQNMMTTNDEVSKASIILTPKVLNEYFQLKDKVIGKLQSYTYKFQKIESNMQGVSIGVSRQKNKDRIKIQKTFNNYSIGQLAQKLSLVKRERNGKLIQFQVLQVFSTNIKVVYFKYFFNKEIYQFLAIMEENIKKDQIYIILKGIDNFINSQYIDFLYLKVKQISKNQVSLKLMGIVKNDQKNKNQALQFLMTLTEPFSSAMLKSDERLIVQNEEFWTVREIDEVMDDDPYYGPSLNNVQIQEKTKRYSIQEKKNCNTSFFSQKFMLQPTQKSPYRFLKQHPLFKQWKIHKNGGVLCTDEEQINVQKKVFKYIISKIGSNILQRKSIMNFSFPVIIFRKQSHLKSVARNLSFAPIFLEKVVHSSPEQKLRAAVLLQISTSILVISMNKPFNPVLGQTYQGFIDGCPIFVQQISHHPPIPYYIFYGRGYRIYGSIQPKVAIGLNCVKGWSPAPNFIQFDDGTILEFSNSKMVINGMLFGERTFNFQGLNYVLDRKNKLIAEITYGNEGSNIFKKKQLSYDSVSGGVYKLTGSQKVNIDNLKKLEKEKLCVFNGLWHSQIFMENKKIFNFYTDLPPELVDYEKPIPSDACYRKDLIQLIKGNIDNSQKEKQFIEQIQRRDRKLRQGFGTTEKNQ